MMARELAMNRVLEDYPLASGSEWRSLLYFTLARLSVIGLLILAHTMLGQKIPSEVPEAQTLALVLVYFAFSCAFAWLAATVRTSFHAQVLAQFFVDAMFLGLLLFQGGGLRSGLAILLLMPLAGVALLLPTGPALFCAALTTLLFLVDSFWRVFSEGGDPQWLAAALHGVGAFAIVLLFRMLTVKVAREERLARDAGEMARKQALVSQQVMGEMEPGVMVLDEDWLIRAINPSARALFVNLGMPLEPGDRLDQHAGMDPLTSLLREMDDAQDNLVREIVLSTSGNAADRYLVRQARVARGMMNESDTVLFIESVRAAEERNQRSKLAAMGRLTGSIAHEIRNPLAAIKHAADLLAEDVDDPGGQRLVSIVRDNAVRINQIVEDVLALARADRAQPMALALDQLAREVIGEMNEGPAVQVSGSARGRFDPLHLRLTLHNLVRNAKRHARSVVQVRLCPLPDGSVELAVMDDGPTIDPQTREHLFEPFYTTQQSGTGLGLYLAREYCVANQARLTYEERPMQGSGELEKMFVIRMRGCQ
jgi:two-component system sensor histidine kinase PilS (NtrC family)